MEYESLGGLSSSIDETMSILKMNYLVYGGVVEDHGTLLRDALADGRSRVVVWSCEIVGGEESGM